MVCLETQLRKPEAMLPVILGVSFIYIYTHFYIFVSYVYTEYHNFSLRFLMVLSTANRKILNAFLYLAIVCPT